MGGRNSTPKKAEVVLNLTKISKQFPAEPHRYHLYVSYSCPFSHRCLLVLLLKGLEDSVSFSLAHPVYQKTKPNDANDSHYGWAFTSSQDESSKQPDQFASESAIFVDPINNVKYVRDLYELAKSSETKYSIPILWDKKTKSIASNDSIEICAYLNSECHKFARNQELDLYPTNLLAEVSEKSGWISKHISNGVYKAGQAATQDDYDTNVQQLFDSLDRAEEILSKTRYICGNQFTLADIILFTPLVRFDEIYNFLFKCNKKRIADYPHLFDYLKELYQIETIGSTVRMDHIKATYYLNFSALNPSKIIPIGPNPLEQLTSPHSRDSLKGLHIPPPPPPRVEVPATEEEQPEEEKKENVVEQVQESVPQQEQEVSSPAVQDSPVTPQDTTVIPQDTTATPQDSSPVIPQDSSPVIPQDSTATPQDSTVASKEEQGSTPQ